MRTRFVDNSENILALTTQPLDSAAEAAFPRVLFVCCEHVRERGGEPAGAVVAKSLLSENRPVAQYRPPDRPLQVLQGSLAGDILARFANKASYIRDLARHISRFDIVHLDTCSVRGITRLAMPALVLAKFFGKKVVLHFGSAEAEEFLEHQAGWFYPMLKSADRIVVGSRYLEKVVGRAKLTATRLRAPVSVGHLHHRVVATRQPRILVDTDLEAGRNVERALRAFKLVKQKYPRTEMVIVRFRQPPVFPSAFCHGQQTQRGSSSPDVLSPEQAARHYAECDCFLHPVTSDETPSSIVRAFAAGLPVVATDADGALHMLRDGLNALVVSVGDHVAMADRIVALVENSDLSRALSERGKIETRRYRWARVRQDWINLYQSLITQTT